MHFKLRYMFLNSICLHYVFRRWEKPTFWLIGCIMKARLWNEMVRRRDQAYRATKLKRGKEIKNLLRNKAPLFLLQCRGHVLEYLKLHRVSWRMRSTLWGINIYIVSIVVSTLNIEKLQETKQTHNFRTYVDNLHYSQKQKIEIKTNLGRDGQR